MSETSEATVQDGPAQSPDCGRRSGQAPPDSRRRVADLHLARLRRRQHERHRRGGQCFEGMCHVYFEDKEHLFVALIQREREAQKRGAIEALNEDSQPGARWAISAAASCA